MADPIQDLMAKVDALTEIVRYGHGRSEARFDRVEQRLDRADTRMEHVETRLGHVDARLDQFIDRELRE